MPAYSEGKSVARYEGEILLLLQRDYNFEVVFEQMWDLAQLADYDGSLRIGLKMIIRQEDPRPRCRNCNYIKGTVSSVQYPCWDKNGLGLTQKNLRRWLERAVQYKPPRLCDGEQIVRFDDIDKVPS